MTGSWELTVGLFIFLAIVVGILYFAASGTRQIYKPKPSSKTPPKRSVSKSEKYVVGLWALVTLACAVIESLQVFAAISVFFLFTYVVWIGIIRPTLK